jgi:hypothetical protein
MDATGFDALARIFAAPTSRRMAGRVLAGLGLSGMLAHMAGTAIAKSGKKDKKHKPKKKPKFNAFDCVDVGGFCTSSRQCCSGICQGKKGKQTCRAHNAGIGQCAAGISDFCAEQDGGLIAGTICTTSADEQGLCFTTTGNAPYCAGSEPESSCSPSIIPCKKDKDCQRFCGPDAACIQCPACKKDFDVETACAGPDDSCLF